MFSRRRDGAPSGGVEKFSGSAETFRRDGAVFSGGAETLSGGAETFTGAAETVLGGADTFTGATETVSGGAGTFTGATETFTGGAKASADGGPAARVALARRGALVPFAGGWPSAAPGTVSITGPVLPCSSGSLFPLFSSVSSIRAISRQVPGRADPARVRRAARELVMRAQRGDAGQLAAVAPGRVACSCSHT
jgi:hypothetical protein